jgi:hypothetical protein
MPHRRWRIRARVPFPKQLVAAKPPATLALDLDAPQQIPVPTMLYEPSGRVHVRAERLARLGARSSGPSRAWAAAPLPLPELESYACAVEGELAAPLRLGEPAVVAVVCDGWTRLDCRTLTDDEVDDVAAAAVAAPG